MKKIAPPASPFTVSVSRFALFPLVLLNAAAQNAPVSQSTDPAPAPTTAWTLKDIGPNSKTWIAPSPPASMLGAQSNPLYPGQSAPPSRFPEQKVTAIATGMNFWDAAQQQWSSSDSTFD